MNSPTPEDDDDDEAIPDALRRDATRVPESPFDAALHDRAMRRIRALADPASRTSRFLLLPALATATAVLAMTAVFFLWRPHPSPKRGLAADLPPPPTAPRASLLAYQAAASAGDEVLFALLDRDARDLLPASSPVFNTTLR